jgi:hypothetical protein
MRNTVPMLLGGLLLALPVRADPVTYLFSGAFPDDGPECGYAISWGEPRKRSLCGAAFEGYFTIDDVPIESDTQWGHYWTLTHPYGLVIKPEGARIRAFMDLQVHVWNDLPVWITGTEVIPGPLDLIVIEGDAPWSEDFFFVSFIDRTGTAISGTQLPADLRGFEPYCRDNDTGCSLLVGDDDMNEKFPGMQTAAAYATTVLDFSLRRMPYVIEIPYGLWSRDLHKPRVDAP